MRVADSYARLLARRIPADDQLLFQEAYQREAGDNTKYVLGAMKPVAAKYTQRLKEQGQRVENQLKNGLAEQYPAVEFERQGSVSNLTHIRYFSDVDVLVIIDKFETLEHPQVPANPYRGNPIDDLRELRRACLAHLKRAFPKVRFDDSGASAIQMSEGSLSCPVDVVPANWYNTNSYARSGLLRDRAIQVLDRDSAERIRNRPFLFNARIDEFDEAHGGVPRALIRLLKTVRADSEEETRTELAVSSFDFCSLVYRTPPEYQGWDVHRPLNMVYGLLLWLKWVLENRTAAQGLMAIDDSRVIFDDNKKIEDLAVIFEDLRVVLNGAVQERGSREITSAAHLG